MDSLQIDQVKITKSELMRDAKEIIKKYRKYKKSSDFKYFAKYIIEELAEDVDLHTLNEIANLLKKIFGRKLNEDYKKYEDD